MKFKLLKSDEQTKARAGEITTDHGKIQTPIFMPVGTGGTVKAVHQHELKEDIKAQIILGNTYHLFLRPGLDVLQKAGGLHKFINWDRPILTDSGGDQVYSLADRRKIKEEGVSFSSHIDGSKLFFSPEYAMDIQRVIGADIIMAFDECTPYPCDHRYAKKSMEMTHRWLKRCCDHVDKTEPLYGHKQTLFPIVQGSVYKDLRLQSAEFIAAPINILESIALGIDMFDCVMPTRNARNGTLFTQNGIMNMRNEKWKDDNSPLDESGTSYVDSYYSKAYVRHLVISKEILAAQICTLHNLAFYLWLVTEARTKILEGTFLSWKNEMVSKLGRKM